MDDHTLSSKAAGVEVIVKRRRFLTREGQLADDHKQDARTTHAPRIFRLANSRRDETKENPGMESPSAESPSLEDDARHEAVEPGLSRFGKRKRRVLNGRVTIIRPILASESVGVSPVEPVGATGAPQDLRDRRSDLGPFRMRKAAERRYDRLLKAIERLELRAAAARKAEAAAAVRWIQRTMARYDIRACEVGA